MYRIITTTATAAITTTTTATATPCRRLRSSSSSSMHSLRSFATCCTLLFVCCHTFHPLKTLAFTPSVLPTITSHQHQQHRAFLGNTLRPNRSLSLPTSSFSSITGSRLSMSSSDSTTEKYSIPDQVARFARAQRENNQRYLDINTVYDPTYFKGKRVAVTGANRGLGLAIATEISHAGGQLIALVRNTSPELDALKPVEVITGVDVQDDAQTAKLYTQIKGGPIDILINNAGYFKTERETLDDLDFPDQIKTIDICAIGPLRITQSLVKGNLLKESSKVIMITSQGGSISWRPTQCPEGGDYGHHMSKAAANMMAMLLAQELKSKGIPVGILHPGFNKTGMTAKYSHIWEIEGAVDPLVGAKRVLYETAQLNLDTTGKFINCEDGLEIPF